MTGYISKKALEQIPPYRPAKPLDEIRKELGLTDIIKLSGNENSLGSSPLAQQAVREAASALNQYADGSCGRLRGKLARAVNVREEQLIFGNGSFELLSLVAQAFLEPGAESVIPEPSFGWYKVVTWTAGASAVSVPLLRHAIDLDKVRDSITDKTRVIWLCNPNNPTGTIFTGAALRRFLEEIPGHVIVVLDEAYYEYVRDERYPQTVELLDRFSNLIILRTFSKIYGLAALRIGYGIAHPELIGLLNRIRLPINVNGLAQIAAAAALDDRDFTSAVLDNNNSGRDFYYRAFTEMGLEYLPTETNFIMVNINADSVAVVAELLRNGISIRAGSEFGMPAWLRITIGTRDENRLVVESLRLALHSVPQSV